MPRPWRPAPEPLDVSVTSVILAGTALWFLAFAVLLFFVDRLSESGHLAWLWTCLAGGVLGLLGLMVAIRQRRPRGGS